MARKIVITSGKGGVGKTTITANLGKALASMGQRVALIDIDFGLNNLDVVMGLESSVLYDIFDVLDGRCRVRQALVQDYYQKNLFILPSNSNKNINVNGQNIKLIIDSISNIFDFILLDCPAGIDIGFHRAVSCVEEAIVIATPNLPSLRDADKVISILKTYNLKNIGLVVNRVRGDLILSDKMLMPTEIERMLKTGLIGILPEEDNVFLSCGDRLPKHSDSAKAFKVLAQNVANKNNKIIDLTSKYSGILGSIRRGLKKSL